MVGKLDVLDLTSAPMTVDVAVVSVVAVDMVIMVVVVVLLCFACARVCNRKYFIFAPKSKYVNF